MKVHLLSLFLWISVLLGSGYYSAYGREIMDATHIRVQLVDKPKRIVTLAPSLSELVAEILGDELDRIVGVSEYSDYPPKMRDRPSIGPYHQFNIEKIVSLKPDLVLATTDGNPSDKILYLRELGMPVVTVATGNFKEMEESIRLVAEALGVSQRGTQIVDQLKTGIERVRDKSKLHSKLRVMLQVGADPLVVVGKQSFLHSALEVTGATNLYSDAKDHYPRPSIEDVLSRDPDVIVILALGDTMEPYLNMAKKWNQFVKMKAVSQHKVYILKSDPLLRPTLRFLEGLSVLNRTLYGKN